MQKFINDLIKINGFIPLDDFIFQAMCHKNYGYYTTRNPLNADFTTSPEITNAFGIIIASFIFDKIVKLNYLDNIDCINLCEFGGGTGKLAFDILSFVESLQKINNKKINNIIKKIIYTSVEFSEKLQEIQKNKLENIGFKKYFFQNIDEFIIYNENKKNINIFISNEFFDALPIKQFIFNKNDFYEIIVTEEINKLLFSQIKINPELFPHNYFEIKNIPENSIIEFPNIGINILEKIINFGKLNKLMFITFDYGFLKNNYQNTLQGIYNSQKTMEILKNIGETDITHLVNFELFEQIITKYGLKKEIKTQREFLLENGIESLINNTNKDGIYRILDKNQMGELFKALYFENL